MNRFITKKLCIFFTVFSFVFLIFSSVVHSSEVFESFHQAKVKDISDRAYEQAVIDLLDNAKESIVISMYILRPQGNGPVDLLMEDLNEALDRGVSVDIYLNTRFKGKSAAKVLENKAFKVLEQKGAKIYLFSPGNRVHDKQVIIDSRFVVEGSHNWSVSALRSNYESSVIIDSFELAQIKRARLKKIPLKDRDVKKTQKKRTYKEIGVLSEDQTVELKKVLLENKRYLPAMVKSRSNRAIDTYLLLLAEAEKRNKNNPTKGEGNILQLSLEDMAFALEIPEKWTNTAKRRQVIKTLRKLKKKYKLIDFAFSHGKDAQVVLRELPGETFSVSGSFFTAKNLVLRTASGDFVLLVKELLRQEGKDFNSFSMAELTKRFHIKKWSLKSGIKELEGEHI